MTEGRTLPAGTATTTVDGLPVGVPDHGILAVVELDVDADGDRDALLALANATETAVGLARRSPEGFAESFLARSPLPEGCTVDAANVRAHSPQIAIVTNRLRCATGPRIGFEVATLGGTSRAAFAVDLEPPAADDPYLASVTVSPRVADANEDGNVDVVFDVETLDRFGGARRKEAFAVSQGITGYAANLGSVTARATAIARSATRDLRRQAARSARDAAHGLAFVRALCPEAGSPRVRIRGSNATCGDAGAPAEFAGTLATALAKTGRFDDFVRLVDLLDASGIALDDATRTAIADGLRTARGRLTPAYQRIPLPPEVTPGSSFGFDATSAVVTRGSAAGSFAAAAPFAFTADDSVVLAPPLNVRRYGDQYVVVRSARARVLGTPAIDGGTVRDCVIDPSARRILCVTDTGPMVAAIGGPP